MQKCVWSVPGLCVACSTVCQPAGGACPCILLLPGKLLFLHVYVCSMRVGFLHYVYS